MGPLKMVVSPREGVTRLEEGALFSDQSDQTDVALLRDVLWAAPSTAECPAGLQFSVGIHSSAIGVEG